MMQQTQQAATQLAKFLSLKLPIGTRSTKHTPQGHGAGPASAATAMFGVERKGPILDDDGCQCFDIIILGGGVAAFSAVSELVKAQGDDSEEGNRFSIAMISRESQPPFFAGKMVEQLAGKKPIDDSLIVTEKWFRDNHITLLLNTQVTFVDVKRRLLVADASESDYASHFRLRATCALILATGARPKPGPPVTLLDDATTTVTYSSFENIPSIEGVFTLRSLEVGRKIDKFLDKSNKIVVVGAGFLGLDMVYIARQRGLQVTLVGGSQLLQNIFTRDMANQYRAFLEHNGITVITNNICTQILARGNRVVGVVLADGTTLDCDMVTVACGVIPNVELFRGQLELEKNTTTPGLLVDSFLLTSVPGVYAIGDLCAMRYSQHNPGAIRHLSNARYSGVHVGRGLMTAMLVTNSHRRSQVSTQKLSGKCAKEYQDKIMRALMPGSGADPYVAHPTYDINHFNFRGFVSGDRLGPDFIQVGQDMGPHNKMVNLWLWENRLVGAFVSNPTDAEKELLNQATKDQWYICDIPELRLKTEAVEALAHIANNHCA
eukprot:c39320_g1_i1.p1 GENE.c39320_g1_i1~~c39320_g1_i1.p1  ORF type:complete len:569 (+),score=119.71 c39320_g1_i1:64-1707(+)